MKLNKQQLAVALAYRDMNYSDLARRTGVAKQTISNGIHGMSLGEKTCRKLADALGLPISAIADEEEG